MGEARWRIGLPVQTSRLFACLDFSRCREGPLMAKTQESVDILIVAPRHLSRTSIGCDTINFGSKKIRWHDIGPEAARVAVKRRLLHRPLPACVITKTAAQGGPHTIAGRCCHERQLVLV